MAKNFVEQITIKAVADGFDKIQQQLEKVGKQTEALSKKMESVGKSLSLSVTAPILAFGALAIKEFAQAEKAIAKVTSALEVTGNRIGVTFDELQKASEDLQKNSIFSDDEILDKVSSQLLRIGTLTKENFFKAQQAVVDLSAALDGDLQGATVQVAKALENPVEAISSLSRIGIRFSKDQQAVIKSLVDTGRAAEAQALIIDRLNAKFEGTAAAIAGTFGGQLIQVKNIFLDLAEVIGGRLVPIFAPLVQSLKDALTNLKSLNPSILDAGIKIGLLAASIGPLLFGLAQLRTAFLAFTGPAGVIFLIISGLIALAEAFDGFKNLGLSVAIVINEAFLTLLDTILSIPNAVAAVIPALGAIKLAASTIRDTVAGSIESLNESLNQNILSQQAEAGGLKTGKAFGTGFNSGLNTELLAGDAITKKLLLEADAEFAKERAEKAKLLPKPFEGSFNIPLDAAQDFAQVEGTLTDLTGRFSEVKKEVVELTQVGQIFTNSLTNGFSNIISGTQSVSEGFRNMGKSLLNALTNAALNAAFESLFKNLGGIFANAGAAANGGAVGSFATGGAVSGPGGPKSDSIPAWLSNGEYVLNAKSASMLGLSLLNKLNSLGKGFSPRSRLGLPAFADGGAVSGGGGVSVNVINNSSQPVNARASTRFDGRQLIIDTFLEDAQNNGQMSQSIQNLYGVRR